MLGSVIMNRLFTRPSLPNALVPTLAIELGIPAVAGLAYFAVAGRTVSLVACALGGYAVLMALLLRSDRRVPRYRRGARLHRGGHAGRQGLVPPKTTPAHRHLL
jgi:tellurite resistance protein